MPPRPEPGDEAGPVVHEAEEPAPFPGAWLETVFLVPFPPAAWPDPFAIVTADNPGGIAHGDAANAAARRSLLELTAREGLEPFVVVGASPDLAHREQGLAIPMRDLRLAAHLAREFGQLGFFWVEDGVVFACVDDSGRGWRLGPWQDRLRDPAPD